MKAPTSQSPNKTSNKMARPKFHANLVPIRGGVPIPSVDQPTLEELEQPDGKKRRRSKDEMAAFRLERIAAREDRQRRKELAASYASQIEALIKRVPEGFQQWGCVRTSAWLQLVTIARRRIKNTSPAQKDRLQRLHATMCIISSMTIEECAALASGGETYLETQRTSTRQRKKVAAPRTSAIYTRW